MFVVLLPRFGPARLFVRSCLSFTIGTPSDSQDTVTRQQLLHASFLFLNFYRLYLYIYRWRRYTTDAFFLFCGHGLDVYHVRIQTIIYNPPPKKHAPLRFLSHIHHKAVQTSHKRYYYNNNYYYCLEAAHYTLNMSSP